MTAAQVAELPALGYSISNSLAATISDNTAYALMASYKFDPFKFFAGYKHIKYANPDRPLSAGFIDIGGYILAFVNNNAYANSKTCRSIGPAFATPSFPTSTLTAAYYGYHQDAYGTGKQAGCSTRRTAPAAAAWRLFPSTPTTT